jgi:flavin-binding protein dodecin
MGGVEPGGYIVSGTNQVAAVVEIISRSVTSFEDAIRRGIAAVGTDREQFVSSAWVKEQRVDVDAGQVIGYQVNLLVTFLIPEGKPLML